MMIFTYIGVVYENMGHYSLLIQGTEEAAGRLNYVRYEIAKYVILNSIFNPF